MAYAAVTSLMETLYLNFLQSEPPFPLEDLEAQIRDDASENLGLLQHILKDMAMEDVEVEFVKAMSSSKGRTKQRLLLRIKACLPRRLHGIFNQAEKRLCEKQPLTYRLREVAEVKQKIVSLHQNLGLLQQSLEIAYDDDARVMKEIRDGLFQVEERIEMELSAIYLAKDSRLHVTACLLRLNEVFKEAEKQADYHRNELIRIQTQYQLTAKASLLGQMPRRGLQFVKASSKFDDNRMVGCDKVFLTILDQLLTQQSTKGRQVVSIVGMGGIGKTTLAHKVYENSLITSHFDKRAWVTISQEYNVEQMLRCLIGCVSETSRDELHEQSTAQDRLAERLYKCLKGQRYLIVIDDIWNTTAWDSVQRCFPDDNNGSRILLTSRLREVAEYASSGNSPINMPFLDADESWSLYCKVFGKIEFPSKFEQIGRDISKKCKGLPLAITIVASLLSKTEEKVEKWKNVAESVTGDSNEACSRVLYLSYNQLPQHLKACFLYFGVLGEDCEIPVKKLVRLWAAEGFLRAVKHQNMEEAAMECLQDLVDRSLVIVSRQSYDGKMKRIRIHDMLRDLCLREARLENLLNVYGIKRPCHWISHTSRSLGDTVITVMFENECFHKSHSFHLTIHYDFGYNVDLKSLFSHLKLLRVIDMNGSFLDRDMGLNVLANLVHLRYFAFSTNQTYGVKLFDHWNMQSFIVSGDGVTLDSSEACGIWKMPLLRNFCIGRIFSLETPSVVHRNLENISWLNPMVCTKNLFRMIPNLKKLGIDAGYYHNNLGNWFYNVVHLGQLETLSITHWGYFKHIPLSRFPWATGLPNLKKLSFLKSMLQWSELNAISMLPNLEVLKLIDACKGLKWEPYGGFRRLKRLVIKKTNFRRWNAVGDHFPMLECLEISECFWLKEIPRGFADITTLALIQLSECRDSLVASAKWIQEEQNNNYGNDALLVRSEYIRNKKLWYEEEESDE